MENKHTAEDLKTMRGWSLERKIMVAQTRIMEWHQHWGGRIAVSYSGGLDSTVALDLVRRMYPEVPAVYAATMDLPEIRKHIHATENVVWVRPKMTFAEVLDKYGLVYPSKDVAECIYYAKRGTAWAVNNFKGQMADGTPSVLKSRIYPRWAYLVDADVKISGRCCAIMKEQPLRKYTRETGNRFVVGTRAEESQRRKVAWMHTGCNSYGKNPVSKPLSIWTHQDVLEYIRRYNIPYAKCYGDIVEDEKTHTLRTTLAQRTGCVGCVVGAHHKDKQNNFRWLKATHPKLWNYIMNTLEVGAFLDYIGADYGKEL